MRRRPEVRTRLIAMGVGARKHPFEPSFKRAKIVPKEGVASENSLAYLTASAAQRCFGTPVLLGNGVMVTLRFLVPSF